MQELVRNKRGLQSDKLLLQTINSHPGLSQYEISQRLDWQSGKVDGAIRRLVNSNQVLIKSTQRNGRLVNLVYPKENKPQNVVEVPISLLQVSQKVWSESAFVYALDSTTIGVAGCEVPEWKEVACFTETIPIKQDRETLVFVLPEQLSRFYHIDRKHKVVSVNGNTVLITISGSIIEEKKYPS